MFNTYAGYKITTKVEWLAKLIGFLLIAAGLFLTAVYFFNNRMAKHYREKAAVEQRKPTGKTGGIKGKGV